jgi:hypothetical protein
VSRLYGAQRRPHFDFDPSGESLTLVYGGQGCITGIKVARCAKVGDAGSCRGLGAEGSGTEDPDVARSRTGADRDIRLTWLGLVDGLQTDRHASGN